MARNNVFYKLDLVVNGRTDYSLTGLLYSMSFLNYIWLSMDVYIMACKNVFSQLNLGVNGRLDYGLSERICTRLLAD